MSTAQIEKKTAQKWKIIAKKNLEAIRRQQVTYAYWEQMFLNKIQQTNLFNFLFLFWIKAILLFNCFLYSVFSFRFFFFWSFINGRVRRSLICKQNKKMKQKKKNWRQCLINFWLTTDVNFQLLLPDFFYLLSSWSSVIKKKKNIKFFI